MKTILFLSMMAAAVPAFASVPVKYNDCHVDIKSVPNGNGVYMSEDCQTAYVLPPVAATASIRALASSENLRLCPALTNVDNSIVSLTSALDRLTAGLQAPVAQPESDGPSGTGPIQVTAGPAPQMNAQQAADMKTLAKEITDEFTDLMSSRSPFTKLQGSIGTFLYSMQMQELVDAYRAANPKIHFEAMPIQRSYLSFERVNKPDFVDGNAVMSLSVPGMGRMPKELDTSIFLPASVKGQGPTQAVQPDDATTRIFGGSLAGGIELSLTGACPYSDPSTHKMPVQLSEHDLTGYLHANVQYAYALQATRSYHASYNLSIMVKKILETKTEGGFFSSKTLRSFVDDEQTNDWFTYKSDSQDPSLDYPYIVQDIKGQLIDRVLRDVNAVKVGGPVAEQGVADPQPDGASAAAKALHQCPNFYCQAAGFVLDVADAIFGSKQATNSFIQNNNYWGHEDVTESVMLEYYGSAGAVGPAAAKD